MNDLSPIAADQTAPPSPVHRPDVPGAIIAAAQRLLPYLERGQRVDTATLRTAGSGFRHLRRLGRLGLEDGL